MAAGNWIVYSNARELVNEGTLDLDSDSFRMVLVTSSYTPAQNTHTAWSDISANEVSGTGYTANGQAITQTVTRSGNVITFDCDDKSWASSTITAKYAVIVKDADSNNALASTDVPLCYADLNTGGGSESSSGAAFNVNINASGVFAETVATS